MGVRVESGVAENSVVPVFYDSLIAKVITVGPTREEAIRRMQGALREYHIGGIKTNIPLHQQILQDPEFLAGNVHTRYLDKFISRPTAITTSGAERIAASA
jgi:acetyl-CoA carboxylase biotin carboxylase subunit